MFKRYQIDEEVEDWFWSVVEGVNWSKDCDFYRAKSELMGSLTQEEASKMILIVEYYTTCLAGFIHSWERSDFDREFPLGGDSYCDFLYHVVGLGREAYNSHIRDIDVCIERAKARDFAESFSYCIPDSSDYAKLSLEYYNEHLQEIVDALNDDEHQEFINTVKDHVKTVLNACQLMNEGKREEFKKVHPVAVHSMDAIVDAYIRDVIGRHVLLCGGKVLENPHIFRNISSDYIRYYCAG